MNIFKRLIASSFIFAITYFAYAATPISVCTDTNFWYPFTFVKENKEAGGLHIDIIRKALTNLGYEPSFKPLPWQQCLSEAKAGHFDAVATVSYKEDRTPFLNYPESAEKGGKSPERVTQVEYVVITPSHDAKGKPITYTFNGDLKTIPSPVRVPKGYSIVENLEKAGLKVEEGPNSIENFKKLVRQKTGSVIDLEEVAKHLATQPEFSEKYTVAKEPIFSKSYFLAFTKKDEKIKEAEQQKIWQEIAKIRNDEKLMGKFLERY